MNLRIEPINTNDYAQLLRFFTRNNIITITRNFNPFPLTHSSAIEITHRTHKDHYYVAFVRDEIVGMAMLRGWEEGYEIPSFGILVDHDFQNRGIGKLLTQYALSAAKRLNCKKVRLSVFASNKNAINLYQSFGFTETTRKLVCVDGEPDEKIVMIKEFTDD